MQSKAGIVSFNQPNSKFFLYQNITAYWKSGHIITDNMEKMPRTCILFITKIFQKFCRTTFLLRSCQARTGEVQLYL